MSEKVYIESGMSKTGVYERCKRFQSEDGHGDFDDDFFVCW